MKTVACSLLILLAAIVAQAQTPAEAEYVNSTLYPSTALLYAQEEGGGMKMRCTATAIEKNATGYIFVTAAHCACEDNDEKLITSPLKTFFFITGDEGVSKDFLRATVTGCGYQHRGDDFALFQVDTKANFPIIPLGTDPKILDRIVNVASPLGLGKQVFFGTVSSPTLDRPVIQDDINWTKAVLLQLFGVNGGSSGSSAVCLDQRAICAFVVGNIGETNIVAMPVSRLIELRKALNAKSYKWYREESDDIPQFHAKKK
jgi:S1-C subfamily serine protease